MFAHCLFDESRIESIFCKTQLRIVRQCLIFVIFNETFLCATREDDDKDDETTLELLWETMMGIL